MATAPGLGPAFLWRHKGLYVAALLSRGAWELVPMHVPLLAGVVVDALAGRGLVLPGAHHPDAPAEAVLRGCGVGLVALAVVYGLTAYLYTTFCARLDRRFVTAVRQQLVGKLGRLRWAEHVRVGEADLLERVAGDTENLRGYTERVFTRTFTNIVRAVYPVAMLFVLSPALAVLALAVVPPQWALGWWLQRRLQAATRRRLARKTEFTRQVKEQLEGAEAIRGVAGGPAAAARLAAAAGRAEAAELACSEWNGWARAVVWAGTGVGLGVVWWVGGGMALRGELSVGTLVALTGFVELAYRPFRNFTHILRTYRTGSVSLERIREVLDLPEEPADGHALDPPDGRVEFRGVTLAHGGSVVFRHLDLVIEPRSLTALVGPSGCGKSSLLRLAVGLTEPDDGQVLIDGRPVADWSFAALRAGVVYVPQKPVLFRDTVRENVRFARPDATDAEVQAACRDAGVLDFAARLPDKLDTVVGDGGPPLSGGQAQRITLARGLLARPRVLLLDEPTAALDPDGERELMRTLRRLCETMTVVVVTHRTAAVDAADRVVRLDDAGRVPSTARNGPAKRF